MNRKGIIYKQQFIETAPLNHRVLVQCILVVLLFTFTSCNKQEAQPNILLIVAEDISIDLGCYGRNDLKTPTLDTLAAQGIKYTNAFTTSPVCSPSRSAIMTGMYQNSIGSHNHRSETGALKNGVRPFTYFLKDAGYYTCNVVNDDYGTGKTDFNFIADNLFDGDDWKQREKGQPFFAQISIYTTHRDDHWYGIENEVNKPVNPEKVTVPSYYPDHPVARLDWARYLNSIQFMDAQVAKLLQRLRDEKLAENTVVIFIGDHGRCHIRGKQWLYDSGIQIPFIIRWPNKFDKGEVNTDLISAIDITATILDIADAEIPDYMEGKSIIADNYKARTEIFAARDRCDGVVDKIRCVRTDSFKYIKNYMPERPYTQFGHYKEFFYPMIHLIRVLDKRGELTEAQSMLLAETKPQEELYDIINDPEEMTNLAELPEYSELLKNFRTKLQSWETETGDDTIQLESDEFMEIFLEKREIKYAPKWEKRGISAHDSPEIHLNWWEQNLEVWRFINNQPMEKEGAKREVFKVVGSDTLYAYIFEPENHKITDNTPAIVFFHGGGWRRGTSSQFDNQGRYLAERGMVVIQADYRVIMRDSITPFECVMDAKAAMRWVRKNAKGLGIDPNRIAAGGGSAGGHLAAACGHLKGLEHADEDLSISSKPNAMVMFNPVFDNGPNGYKYEWFNEQYTNISPVHNVKKDDPPALVMLGDNDENISVTSANYYKQQMDSAGNKCITKVYVGQKHGFFNPSKGGYEMYAQTVYEMDKFLSDLGYLQGEPTIDLTKERN